MQVAVLANTSTRRHQIHPVWVDYRSWTNTRGWWSRTAPVERPSGFRSLVVHRKEAKWENKPSILVEILLLSILCLCQNSIRFRAYESSSLRNNIENGRKNWLLTLFIRPSVIRNVEIHSGKYSVNKNGKRHRKNSLVSQNKNLKSINSFCYIFMKSLDVFHCLKLIKSLKISFCPAFAKFFSTKT